MFRLECRYSYWTREGLAWTKRFYTYDSPVNTIEEAKELKKAAEQKSKSVDKATNTKHEFFIVEI